MRSNLVEKIIPDSVYQTEGMFRNKYLHNDWLICIGCGFVKNLETLETIRFSYNNQVFDVLNKIK